MAKNYKDYEEKYIGSSDISSLIMVGCRVTEGLVMEPLHFGSDGSYSAYVVDSDAEIGQHYTLVASFDHWLKIYDDQGLTYSVRGRIIRVYRAGNFGCIIKIYDEC